MPTMKQLRQQSGLSAEQLAVYADVSLSTVLRMEKGTPVNRLNAYRVLNVISERIGTRIEEGDVDGLKISEGK